MNTLGKKLSCLYPVSNDIWAYLGPRLSLRHTAFVVYSFYDLYDAMSKSVQYLCFKKKLTKLMKMRFSSIMLRAS